IEDWIDVCKQRGDLYRLEYKPETVFDSDMVIERGRTRLGEVQYNIFGNNCEHFARWCKTGVGKSEQVESFTSTLKRIG
ncbi:NC domain-containing protein, partial [Bacillus thuringiensis]|nr:NC domain-containing protein [Bacillus thuringiensis]